MLGTTVVKRLARPAATVALAAQNRALAAQARADAALTALTALGLNPTDKARLAVLRAKPSRTAAENFEMLNLLADVVLRL